jgi:hypothetical protein
MQLTVIGNVSELSPVEQKALYTEGADIYTGVYYLVAEAELFKMQGKDVIPDLPALRALSASAGITWIITHFRGKKVAFGSASS